MALLHLKGQQQVQLWLKATAHHRQLLAASQPTAHL
jgi:hypothetical protein